jgi:hypothetical protein
MSTPAQISPDGTSSMKAHDFSALGEEEGILRQQNVGMTPHEARPDALFGHGGGCRQT